jgi:hypothetical protein
MKDKVIALGADCFIEVPFFPEKLSRWITCLIGRRK